MADIMAPDDNNLSPALPEDSRGSRLFRLLGKIAANEAQRYRRTQKFGFPFYVDEQHLKDIESQVTESLNSVLTPEPVEFIGLVKFQDSSSQRFDTFKGFLDHAGRQDDPDSIELICKCILIT